MTSEAIDKNFIITSHVSKTTGFPNFFSARILSVLFSKALFWDGTLDDIIY